MKRLLVNVVALFLPGRRRRDSFRRRLMHFCVRDILAAKRFAKTGSRENSVLLVEENDTHGEVISGYLPYFQELGFRVDVLMNSALLREHPFCRQDMSEVKVYHCLYGMFSAFLSCPRIAGYSHVVLMTSAGYRFIDGSDAASIVAAQPEWGRIRSLLVVEHELRDIERFREQRLLDEGRLLTLGRFDKGVFVCPMRFGNVKITPKNRIVTFVCVGTISSARKNFSRLYESIGRLDAEGLDFRVVVIGRGDPGPLPAAVCRHLEFAGALDYPSMFDRLEDADFYLPLLDRDNPAHDRYITSGVTGSAQLIYAFAKVPVIDPRFAAFYGFDEHNAVLAESLSAGMTAAISMDPDEYRRRQHSLANLGRSLQAESMDNLRKALGVGGRRS